MIDLWIMSLTALCVALIAILRHQDKDAKAHKDSDIKRTTYGQSKFTSPAYKLAPHKAESCPPYQNPPVIPIESPMVAASYYSQNSGYIPALAANANVSSVYVSNCTPNLLHRWHGGILDGFMGGEWKPLYSDHEQGSNE